MFFEKEIRIILKGQAKEAYLKLKQRNDKESISILNSFERIKKILRENPQFGNPISKNLIPNELRKQDIKNLYRIELSNYWRMIYTLEGNRLEIFLFVLKMFNHQEYNKFFGYK